MKVAAVQYDIAWEDPTQNFQRLRGRVADAARAGASLVVLPEMFSCGFSKATERIAEPFGGPSAQFVAEQAREHGVWVCGSFPELQQTSEGSSESRPANTLVLSSPEGELSRYEKIHPFTFAREHEHYRAGTEFLVRDVCGVSCCFFVCYDLRFANEFWVNAPRTDCYVVVANWPVKRRTHWQALLLARAIENQAYVVGVNRVGKGGELDYAGDSAVIDPLGQTLCCAAIGETTLYAELDADLVNQARARFPVLQDRRANI